MPKSVAGSVYATLSLLVWNVVQATVSATLVEVVPTAGKMLENAINKKESRVRPFWGRTRFHYQGSALGTWSRICARVSIYLCTNVSIQLSFTTSTLQIVIESSRKLFE